MFPYSVITSDNFQRVVNQETAYTLKDDSNLIDQCYTSYVLSKKWYPKEPNFEIEIQEIAKTAD